MWIEILAGLFVMVGAFFMTLAAIGVWRFADFYTRVHAPTKAATLGLFFLLFGTAIWQGEGVVWAKALLAVLFIGATAPVGAHLLTRAAYRSGIRPAVDPSPDEYAPEVARQRARWHPERPGHLRDADPETEEHPRDP